MSEFSQSDASSSVSSTLQAAGNKLVKVGSTTHNYNSVAVAALVIAGLAMIPSALGVAQYTELTCGRTEKEHTIYAIQATLLSIATVIFVLAGISLILRHVQKNKAGKGSM